MSKLSAVSLHLQRHLFPALEEEIGTLSQRERKFVRIVELADIPAFAAKMKMGWCGIGRRPSSREALAKAFVAKVVWNLPATAALIDMLRSSPNLRRLCGWDRAADIPHESIFSRAFAAFAERELPGKIHERLVRSFLANRLCGHISRDSTAIEGRENPAPKKESGPRKPKKRGRPRRGEQREKPPPSRTEAQPLRSLEEKNPPNCPAHATSAARPAARAASRPGLATSCTSTSSMATSPWAPCSPAPRSTTRRLPSPPHR